MALYSIQIESQSCISFGYPDYYPNLKKFEVIKTPELKNFGGDSS